MRSGKVIAKEYEGKFKAYLDAVDQLPLSSNGSLNIQAIADAAGIPRQSIYKNPKIKQVLDDVRHQKGYRLRAEQLASVATDQAAETPNEPNVTKPKRKTSRIKKYDDVERQLSLLQQRFAVVIAENDKLKSELKRLRMQMGREDMMIETGRRVPPPVVSDG